MTTLEGKLIRQINPPKERPKEDESDLHTTHNVVDFCIRWTISLGDDTQFTE